MVPFCCCKSNKTITFYFLSIRHFDTIANNTIFLFFFCKRRNHKQFPFWTIEPIKPLLSPQEHARKCTISLFHGQRCCNRKITTHYGRYDNHCSNYSSPPTQSFSYTTSLWILTFGTSVDQDCAQQFCPAKISRQTAKRLERQSGVKLYDPYPSRRRLPFLAPERLPRMTSQGDFRGKLRMRFVPAGSMAVDLLRMIFVEFWFAK